MRFYGPVIPLGSCKVSQLTFSYCTQAGLSSKCLTSTYTFVINIYTFVINRQMPFLNQFMGENECRNYFMIKLHECYVVKLEFGLVTPGSAVRRTTDCKKGRCSTIIIPPFLCDTFTECTLPCSRYFSHTKWKVFLQFMWAVKTLTLCMLGNFACFFVVCGLFLTSSFLKKNHSENTIRVSKSLAPDKAQYFVSPGLGPNCLQRLSADDKSRL